MAPSFAWWRAAVVGASALTLALGLLVAVWLLGRPLALLFAAIVIAQALAPVVGWLERWLPRGIAIALVYVGLLLAVIALGWVMVPRLVDQAQDLAATAPDLIERLRARAERWEPGNSARIIEALQRNVNRFAASLVTLPLAIASSLTQIVLVLFMSVYWLIAMPALHRFGLSLFPERRRERAAAVWHELGQTVGGYVRAVAINGVLVAVGDYIGFSFIGVQYPIVLALIGALGELVPVIGPILATVPAVGVALLESPTQALIVLGFKIVVQQVESNVLVPLVMRRQANIPPLLALVALFAGSEIGGILGAIVAIPAAGALRVLVVRVIAPGIRRWSGAGDPDAVIPRAPQ